MNINSTRQNPLKALAVNSIPVILVWGYMHWGYNVLFVTLLPLRHRDRKTCSSRYTVVVNSHLSPSEVFTGHRTRHHSRPSDNLAFHSECIH